MFWSQQPIGKGCWANRFKVKRVGSKHNEWDHCRKQQSLRFSGIRKAICHQPMAWSLSSLYSLLSDLMISLKEKLPTLICFEQVWWIFQKKSRQITSNLVVDLMHGWAHTILQGEYKVFFSERKRRNKIHTIFLPVLWELILDKSSGEDKSVCNSHKN